jgi:hypothetical protein
MDNARVHFQYMHTPEVGETELIEVTLQRWAGSRLSGFVEATLPTEILDWGTMDPIEEFRAVDAMLPTWRREEHPLDFDLVRAAHVWLPTPDKALDSVERATILAFWRQALAQIISRPARWPASRRTDEQRYPYEHELWVLDGIAAALPYLTASELPEALWEPILGVQDEAEHWAGEFLRRFHDHALRADVTPNGYVVLLRAMFAYALAQRSETDSLWRHSSEAWRALMGLTGYEPKIWQQRYQGLVAELADLYEQWAQIKLSDVRCLTAFAQFLTQPSAEVLLFKGLVWLVNAITAHRRLLDDHYAQDALAALLYQMWHAHRARLSSDERAREAFQVLLSALLMLRHPVALDLQGGIDNV